MNKKLDEIVKRSPHLNSPLEQAISALWVLDNDDETKESAIANQATYDLIELQNYQSAQQSVQLTALRRGLAVSIFINVILLAVVHLIIGGN